MALLAALLPNERDRESLRAADASSEIIWASSWTELQRTVRDRAVALAITDFNAERRRDGPLRVHRFHRRFPATPIVVWGEPDARELFRLGKAGARDVVLSRDAVDPVIVREIVRAAEGERLSAVLAVRLDERLDPDALAVVTVAADRIPAQIQVPELAAAFSMSVSTMERRCERWGLPSPGRLLLWLRVLYAVRWLLEPGRSVESVASQLGYSSGAALRRAIKATIGGRPSPLRTPMGLEHALTLFLEECVGGEAV
jgi:AraC-like DNA-binding protein